MADQEFVYIRGKDQGDDVLPGRVTRKAYDRIWAGKGFTIVPDEEAELAGSPATQAEIRAGSSDPATEPVMADAGATSRKKG